MSRLKTLLVLVVAAGCSNEPGSTTDVVSAAHERAKAAAGDFSGRLRAALMERMQSAGPVAAVDFCKVEAPLFADAVMAEHGVRLGRVAVQGRNRNPGNAPTDWRLQALARFQPAVDTGAAPTEELFVQRDDLPPGVALRMMRGIAVEPDCLACHGRAIAPVVAEAIARHYPDDAAKGFAPGDLRGGLWIEVPTSPQPTLEKRLE